MDLTLKFSIDITKEQEDVSWILSEKAHGFWMDILSEFSKYNLNFELEEFKRNRGENA